MSSLKNFTKVFESAKLSLFTQGGDTASPLYDPKDPADIKRLCNNAQLEQFIGEIDDKNFPRVLIFENKRYNRGVVAAEPIKKGQYIGEYLGELGSIFKTINRNTVKKNIIQTFKCVNKQYSADELKAAIDGYIQKVTAYAFEVSSKARKNDCVLAHHKRSLVAFINHNSTDPNVTTEIKKGRIFYRAERDIAKGEQLRIDYGPDYDYHEGMTYIPCTENHLAPARFLADHLQYYHTTPKRLSNQQMAALGTPHRFVLLPRFLHQLLNNKKTIITDEYIKRLPVIEIADIVTKKKSRSRYQLIIATEQQNITTLMYAFTTLHTSTLNTLIYDYQIDIYAKTLKDKDALFVAFYTISSEKLFIKLTKPLLKRITTGSLRLDELSSDQFGNSLLHDLVLREWTKAIKLFNKKVFFEVIDRDNYDPLLCAIAHGKIKSLRTLLKINVVKKSLRKLLLAEEVIDGNYSYVLQRAYKTLSNQMRQSIKKTLLNVAKGQQFNRTLNNLWNA